MDEDCLMAALHQKEREEALRAWEIIIILLAAAERPLFYTERYQLAQELGIASMFKQVALLQSTGE